MNISHGIEDIEARQVVQNVNDANINAEFGRGRNCTIQSSVFSTTPLVPTALASFPRSGNSFTRGILEKATGIATASVFNDQK
jgi:hypothetical protein